MSSPGIDRRLLLKAAAALAAEYATGCARGATRRSPGNRARQTRPPAPRTLAQAMRGPVIARGARGFREAAHVYNQRFDFVSPRAVARPLDTLDARAAVRWAVANGVALTPRSGGHSYEGYSTVSDGVVLDLRSMRSISVDRRAGTATIGAGAQLVDVYAGLADHGVTLPAGSCPSVGIAGHALGGGMGLAGRAWGLSADNLLAVRLLTADGRVRDVEQRSDPDLLWALRGGGGGNFGVATALTFRVHRLPPSAAWFIVRWPWSRASEALAAWLAWAPHTTDRATSIMHLDAGGGTASVNVSGQYLGPASDLGGLLAPLRSVSGARVSSGDQDYLGLQLRWAGCLNQSQKSCHTQGTRTGGALPRESFRAKSDYLERPLAARARARLVAAVQARLREPGSGAVLFDAYGGAIGRVPAHATAFVHRSALCAIQYLTYGGGADWLRSTHAAMRPYVSGLAYQNYIDRELRDWRHAYYGSNYPRLVATRKRVDPQHFFRFPQAIGR